MFGVGSTLKVSGCRCWHDCGDVCGALKLDEAVAASEGLPLCTEEAGAALRRQAALAVFMPEAYTGTFLL